MVFRYSVVPDAAAVKPGVLLGPAMPAFGSPLDNQVTAFQATLGEISAAVERAADRPPPAGPDAQPSPNPQPSPPPGADPGFGQDPPASPFINTCCGTSVNRLNVILSAVLQSLPDFVAKFKNTNLLAAALRMLTTMPSQLGELRSAFRSFKQATDKEAAKAALAQLASAATALHQSTKAAFQKEPAP